MTGTQRRAMSLVGLLLAALLLLTTCGVTGQASGQGTPLYVQDLTDKAQTYTGQEVTVEGAYVGRQNLSVLALGVSTLDSGLDAQPLGEPIWIEGFPVETTEQLHNPGDSVYGFVRVKGVFETDGSYGTDGNYKYRLQVRNAEAIEQVQRVEKRLENRAAPAGQVSFFDLAQDPMKYNGQTITTQGYYFWNSVIYVLAEGVSTEEDGSSPQPLGEKIWMEGFPPDQSANLNLGPNTSFVWGLVEVTGTVQAGGSFGKDGAYKAQFTIVDGKARSLEPPK